MLWWGIHLTARPLKNKGVQDIAAQKHRAQLQVLLFMAAGALGAVGTLRWAGRV